MLRIRTYSPCDSGHAYSVGASANHDEIRGSGGSNKDRQGRARHNRHVSGKNVVVKALDGTLRHFDNVPDSVTVTVNGKQLNVHQLQPGMKVERQTITTTTPKVITTVKTVTGTVWYVAPPNSVILRMENGKNQQFKIPKGQKFMVNGQETDAFGLRKGMKVDAQQVIEQPETVVAQEVKRTGVMPPPPPAPAPDVPILVLVVPVEQPAPVETAAAEPTPEPAPEKLLTTATNLPLIGLLGVLFCGLSLATMALRGSISRLPAETLIDKRISLPEAMPRRTVSTQKPVGREYSFHSNRLLPRRGPEFPFKTSAVSACLQSPP